MDAIGYPAVSSLSKGVGAKISWVLKQLGMIPLYDMSKIGESVDTERRLVVARGWSGGNRE